MRRLLATVLSAALLAAPSASAEGADGGTVYLTIENDVFAGNDDGYTSGFQTGWVSGPLDSFEDAPLPGPLADLFESLPCCVDGRQRFVAYSIAQRMFTPQDIARADRIADDVPYTGLLVGSVTAGSQDDRHLDALTFTLGVVGPSALAGEVQSAIHEAIGSRRPRGWRHQIDDAPIVNLQYEHRHRAAIFGGRPSLPGGDVILSGSASLGNMLTMTTAAAHLRWGWNVPDDYFVPPPFFGEETVGFLPRGPRGPRWAVYGALTLDASLLGHVIYLDGHPWSDAHRVDHDRWTARVHVGLHAKLGSVGVAVSLVHATVPWDRPDGKRWDRYGHLSISYDL